jgi:hypothetical protein
MARPTRVTRHGGMRKLQESIDRKIDGLSADMDSVSTVDLRNASGRQVRLGPTFQLPGPSMASTITSMSLMLSGWFWKSYIIPPA